MTNNPARRIKGFDCHCDVIIIFKKKTRKENEIV